MATTRRQVPRPAAVPRLVGNSRAPCPFGSCHHLVRHDSAACETIVRAAGLACHPWAACDPAVIPECRGRLSIGFQITAGKLQGQFEYGYRTDWRQVLTTILWGGQIDDVSRRVLTDALRITADERRPVRIHAFAVAARDLFRQAARTLGVRHRARHRRGCLGHPHRRAQPDEFIPAAAPLHDGLLAAAHDSRSAASFQPCVTVVDGTEAHEYLHDALSDLQELSVSLEDYLEQVLRPLTLPVSRDAIHAVILEIRREMDELGACCTNGEAYVERLTIAEPNDRAVSFEVEAFLGVSLRRDSLPDITPICM